MDNYLIGYEAMLTELKGFTSGDESTVSQRKMMELLESIERGRQLGLNTDALQAELVVHYKKWKYDIQDETARKPMGAGPAPTWPFADLSPAAGSPLQGAPQRDSAMPMSEKQSPEDDSPPAPAADGGALQD